MKGFFYYIKALQYRLRPLFSFRTYWVKQKFKRCGSSLFVGKNIRLVNPQFVVLGKDVALRESCELCCNQCLGKEPALFIGDRVSVGKYTCIGCSNSIIIGNDVLIAPFVHITDRSHKYEDIHVSVIRQGDCSKGPVVIGDECWLGFGVQIMPGVNIGKHCVIAAGSVVTRDIPDYSVAVGNPAKVVKQYNFEEKKWLKV